MAKSRVWSKEELDELISVFPYTANEELADKYGVSTDVLRRKANSLGSFKDKSIFTSGKAKKTQEQFEAEVKEKLVGNITIGKYVTNATNVELICDKGHKFLLMPNSIRQKKKIECKICAGKSTYVHWGDDEGLKLNKLIELFNKGIPYKEIGIIMGTSECSIQRAISVNGLANIRSKFDNTLKELVDICLEINYEICNLDDLTNSHDLVKYNCDKGHYGQTFIYNFKNRGDRCSECAKLNGTSTAENELLNYIKSVYEGEIVLKDRSILGGRELDIVLPDLGLAFEYNGVYWHSEVHVESNYHKLKTDNVEEFGYNLIHINEDDWLYKKDIVKSRINSKLGCTKRIFARNCTIRPIEFSEAKLFLEACHIQGCGSPTKYNYGLVYLGNIVAVMTFNTARFTNKHQFELVRYASCLNTTVVGGASKLLKHFRVKETGSIVSYSDRKWSTGELYKVLGFSFSHRSEPNYRYYKNTFSYSRYQCQKHKLKDLFPDMYKEELTENEIMKLAGFYKVYDSGNDVWVLD